jgi:serine carboxypeptidase 1
VGVGYSYVEDESLLVTTDWQKAEDATVLIKALVEEVPALQAGPLFLVAESYGGKYAATIGASVARAVRAGKLNVTLGGDNILFSSLLFLPTPISIDRFFPDDLGDSWISPEDFTVSTRMTLTSQQSRVFPSFFP